MLNQGLYTSTHAEWYTPEWFLARVRDFYGGAYFDPCPALGGAELQHDGLAASWKSPAFLNPPYGRTIGQWVQKALQEEVEIIMLLPARTDTAWCQPLLVHPECTLCFLKGRLKFSGSTNSAPFPSLLVYRGRNRRGFIQHFGDLGAML